MKNIVRLFAGLLATGLALTAHAEVRMPALFSDNMVLQQGAALPIWGWAKDGEEITVRFLDQEVTATAAAGKWKVILAPVAAGGPHEMVIRGENEITIRNILAGENWICGGQSNMAFPVERALEPEATIAGATLPQIRLFQVEVAGADTPQEDVKAQWVVCSPETVAKFSAVGYFFGKGLNQQLNVPVGLIQSCLGGTNASSWLPRAALAAAPEFADILAEFDAAVAAYPEAKAAYDTALAEYQARLEKAKADGVELTPEERRGPVEPMGPQHVKRPGALYNAMIAPLQPFAVKGTIWYQGEANAKSVAAAQLYKLLFPAVIQEWRKAWGQDRFPFLFVQLAAYSDHPAWPLLRDAQTATLALPDTAMAVSIDVGLKDNIHPPDKATVGNRLVQAARNAAYGEDVEATGPIFLELEKREGLAIVYFRNASDGLRSSTKPLTGFYVAGEDGVFVPANAAIAGQTVIVRAEGVARPMHVRYGWQAFPDPPCTLYNGSGLPAVPFRTDELPVEEPVPK